MASNDYDDLLESFMNNSQKVYNDDKDKLKQSLPSSYNTYSKENSKKTADKHNRQNNKKKQPKSAASIVLTNIAKVLLGVLMIVGVVGVVCLSVLAIYGYNVVYGDSVFDLKNEATSQNQTSIIYAYDDNDKLVEVTRLHGEENRLWLESKDMTEYLADAFVAIEDERFESHHGVDWIRTVGVIVKPTNAGQGGSTITQQLIKNLTDQNDVAFVRKFNEILSALNLEKHYSKDEIMEAYLNTIYLSHGCYGVKTAAETYFGKDVKDLNIAECATLAGITQKPTYYDPLLNPENNKKKQERILKKMYKQGFITKAQYVEAVDYELVFTNSKNYKGSLVTTSAKKENSSKSINSYYTDYVIDQVINDLQKNGYSAKKARNMIYGGGLKIYSAIDFDVQDSIEEVYENYSKMPDETVQGACVVMDYKGRILGLVGGTGKKKENRVLNRAWQSKRQPGSSIKPLSVYGPALQKSLDDDDVNIFWTTPTKDVPLTKIDGKPFPTNDGGGYSGRTVSLQYGLAHSLNTISAQTLDKIGIDYSYDFITNRFHISTLEPYDCDLAPMATGSLTYGVTVLEMTTAYQAYGNGGYYYEGYSYYKIEDSQGNVIIEKNPESTKEVALSENTSWLMNKMMQTVCTQGTGRSFKISGVECFGKTGTTSDSKDRWFMAGTPEYMCGVWYGYDDNKTIHYYQSSNPAGTMWNQVINKIYDKKGINKHEFPECDGIVRKSFNGSSGWFDVNNLPKGDNAYTGIDGAAENRTRSRKDKTTKRDNTNNSDESTTDNSNETQVSEGDNGESGETKGETTSSSGGDAETSKHTEPTADSGDNESGDSGEG